MFDGPRAQDPVGAVFPVCPRHPATAPARASGRARRSLSSAQPGAPPLSGGAAARAWRASPGGACLAGFPAAGAAARAESGMHGSGCGHGSATRHHRIATAGRDLLPKPPATTRWGTAPLRGVTTAKEAHYGQECPPVCVCLLLQDLVQSCLRGEGGILEDMCYERRRAEACVDQSTHHALVTAGEREIV